MLEKNKQLKQNIKRLSNRDKKEIINLIYFRNKLKEQNRK